MMLVLAASMMLFAALVPTGPAQAEVPGRTGGSCSRG